MAGRRVGVRGTDLSEPAGVCVYVCAIWINKKSPGDSDFIIGLEKYDKDNFFFILFFN